MSGDIEEKNDAEKDDSAVAEELSTEDTIVGLVDIDEAAADGLSMEVNVEELVAKIEKEDPSEVEKQRAVRKKLESIHESKSKELDSTYNFNLDDDI